MADLLHPGYMLEKSPPKPISFDEYARIAKAEYISLLESSNYEADYQIFFEKNPAFLPGAFQVVGHSGHEPYLNALISQPYIENTITRKPDFMWLASDSLCFCPVLIEIERPLKAEFRKDEVTRCGFTQASDQIIQWKALLSDPEGIISFYDRYAIPLNLRKLKFKPQYVLIFGRREEYENNDWLTRFRAEKQTDDFRIISYDRLIEPSRDVYDVITCKVSNKQYNVISVPPTFVYRPSLAENLSHYCHFTDAVERMEHTADDRKAFIRQRFDYWRRFGQGADKGIICTDDRE